MKAKEYAAQFFAKGKTPEALYDVFVGMMTDAQTLMKARNAQQGEAFVAILEETFQKWKAFSRITGIDENLFLKLHEAAFPKFHTAWMRVREFKKIKNQILV